MNSFIRKLAVRPGFHSRVLAAHNTSSIVAPVLSTTTTYRRSFTSDDTATTSSSCFTPPPLNKYHGTAVYENIDISALSSKNTESSGFRRNSDPEAVHVVTGASRGMGLQYVESLLARTQGIVVATCRDPDNASLLHQFLSDSDDEYSGRVQILQLDVTNQAQIDKVATELDRVDSLFNVAGVLGNPAIITNGDPGPERNIKLLDANWLEQQFKINAIGPMMLTKALAPWMVSKKGQRSSRPAESVVVNMSARVASLSDNVAGLPGWHSYRMSKAALNMGTRTISHELKRQGTWSIALYPGMTDTDMSKPFQKGVKPEMIFPVTFTVNRMLDVVDGMEEKHSGGFFDWAGQAIPF